MRAPHAHRFLWVRGILTVLWMAMVVAGGWLIYVNSFPALWRFGSTSTVRPDAADVGFILGAALIVGAAAIVLMLGAKWWHGALIAVPALCLPIGLATSNPVAVWIVLGVGLITAAIGGTGAALATFPPEEPTAV